MKKIILSVLTIALFFSKVSYSQEIKRNSAYFEGAGNAVFYSINYDRIIPLNEQFKLIPRVGFMYLPLSNQRSNNTYGDINIPLELNLTWGKNEKTKNFPELGLGLNLISIKSGYILGADDNVIKYTSRFAKVGTIRAGFRHQKPEGGLMYRIGLLIPVTQDEYSKMRSGDDIFYQLYGGISLGWSF